MDRSTSSFYTRYARELQGRARAESPRSAVSAWFGRAFAPGARVLDIGAGSGRDLVALLSQGCEAYGVEPHPGMRETAVRAHPALAARLAGGALPDLNPPFDTPFDGLVCSAVLMHVSPGQLPASLDTLCHLLAPAGRLLLAVPSMAANRLKEGRDEDGRSFTNHDPARLEAGLSARGLRLVDGEDIDTLLAATGTRWHVRLLEK
ncbi:MAG TPA: class I SAM-dependent methyltransferase [Burkholderiaceae bacterium]|nr:class I SAM-dependent methyltransferase [Burkholderiaceae bacterium]